jgi:hypothetical protein
MDAELKTLWKGRSGEHWSYFCPMCRAPRRLSYRPKAGSVRHFAQVLSATAFVTLLTWPLFGLKGIVSFVPLWIIFEAAFRTRVRAAVSCQSCGFDPFLYLVDVQKARAGVEAHWRRKFAEKGIPYPSDRAATQQSPEQSPEA